MKSIFLDANILIDYIAERQPELDGLKFLFQNDDRFNIFISALSVHIAIYILKLKHGTKEFKAFSKVISRLNIIPLNNAIIQKAVQTNYTDFEDLLQFFSATEFCDTILTRDSKDFEKIKILLKSKINIINSIKYQ